MLRELRDLKRKLQRFDNITITRLEEISVPREAKYQMYPAVERMAKMEGTLKSKHQDDLDEEYEFWLIGYVNENGMEWFEYESIKGGTETLDDLSLVYSDFLHIDDNAIYNE